MQVQSVNNQYLIQIEQSAIALTDLQKMLDYLCFKSIVTRSEATEADIEQVADEIAQSGWDGLKNDLLARIAR